MMHWFHISGVATLLSGLSATVARQAAHMLVPEGFQSNSLWQRSQLQSRIIIKVQPANPKPSVASMCFTAPSIVSDLFTLYIYWNNALWFALCQLLLQQRWGWARWPWLARVKGSHCRNVAVLLCAVNGSCLLTAGVWLECEGSGGEMESDAILGTQLPPPH